MQEQRPNAQQQHPHQPPPLRGVPSSPPPPSLPRAAAATSAAPHHGPARITAPPVLQNKMVDLDPIELEDEDSVAPAPPTSTGVASGAAAPSQSPSKIRQFATSIGNLQHQDSYKRPTTVDGRGAVRVRSFHGRLSDEGLVYMDSKINEWLDAHPDIEVKNATTTVGLYDGKIKEPALVVNIWY